MVNFVFVNCGPLPPGVLHSQNLERWNAPFSRASLAQSTKGSECDSDSVARPSLRKPWSPSERKCGGHSAHHWNIRCTLTRQLGRCLGTPPTLGVLQLCPFPRSDVAGGFHFDVLRISGLRTPSVWTFINPFRLGERFPL